MPDDFFQEPTQEAPVEKIKVGEEEYTQEDLQKLVGLGKIGLEAENKYKTRIDRVWPKFQQVINEKQVVDQKLQEYEKRLAEGVQQKQQAQQGTPLSPEQMKAEAVKQARELGLVTREDIEKLATQKAAEMIQGQRLVDDISSVIDDMTAEGLPSTTVEDMITHMQETGIKNPMKAYKDMFEKEYVESQAKKLTQIRPSGIPAVSASNAGGKQPAPVRITNANLSQVVDEFFNSRG